MHHETTHKERQKILDSQQVVSQTGMVEQLQETLFDHQSSHQFQFGQGRECQAPLVCSGRPGGDRGIVVCSLIIGIDRVELGRDGGYSWLRSFDAVGVGSVMLILIEKFVKDQEVRDCSVQDSWYLGAE